MSNISFIKYVATYEPLLRINTKSHQLMAIGNTLFYGKLRINEKSSLQTHYSLGLQRLNDWPFLITLTELRQ